MEKITTAPENPEREAGDNTTRREFLSTLTKSAAALVGATLPGCAYSEAQLGTVTSDAELNEELKGSGLLVVSDLETYAATQTLVVFRESRHGCARVKRQEDSSYIVYYSIDGVEDDQPIDPGRAFEVSFETARTFETAAETATFLIETFDTPKAVVEKE